MRLLVVLGANGYGLAVVPLADEDGAVLCISAAMPGAVGKWVGELSPLSDVGFAELLASGLEYLGLDVLQDVS